MDKDTTIFGEISLSNIYADIYNSSKNKSSQIDFFLEKLNSLIKQPQDAMIIVPLIKEYFEVAVANDGNMVKLAAIIQRMISAIKIGGGGETGAFTEDERQSLIKDINAQRALAKSVDTNVSNRLTTLIDKADAAIKDLEGENVNV
jgi:hypothetical protein